MLTTLMTRYEDDFCNALTEAIPSIIPMEDVHGLLYSLEDYNGECIINFKNQKNVTVLVYRLEEKCNLREFIAKKAPQVASERGHLKNLFKDMFIKKYITPKKVQLVAMNTNKHHITKRDKGIDKVYDLSAKAYNFKKQVAML